MSNENDRPGHTWGDEYEEDDPQTLRDAYLRAVNQNRLQSRSVNTSPNDQPEIPDRSGNRARPRNTPNGASRPDGSTEQSARPRPARQSREEVYARLRQRPRQPIYSRDPEETRAKPPTQARKQERPPSYREEVEEYPYHQQASIRTPRPTRGAAPGGSARPGQRAVDRSTAYEEYDEYEISQPRKRRHTPQHRRKPTRGKSVFSTLLTGCVGGLLTLIIVAAVVVYLLVNKTPLGQSLNRLSKITYTRSAQQALSLGSATQLIVRNQAGSVSVKIDQSASSASLSSVKKVQASNQSDANSQYNGITLTTTQISQGADPACKSSSCLLITTTLPTAAGSGGLPGANNGNTIDLSITLPASFNSPDPLSPYTIGVTAPAGNIAVDGFNGLLNLTGNVGTINVTHTLIYAGTCIQTMHGNVNVGQDSFFNLAQPSKLVPCSNTISSDMHPWFNLRSSVGDVNVTLTTNSTNLLLDANTNNGKISDDFSLNIATDGNSATYHNPLLPNTNPTASLYLFTSTGNIAVNRA